MSICAVMLNKYGMRKCKENYDHLYERTNFKLVALFSQRLLFPFGTVITLYAVLGHRKC